MSTALGKRLICQGLVSHLYPSFLASEGEVTETQLPQLCRLSFDTTEQAALRGGREVRHVRTDDAKVRALGLFVRLLFKKRSWHQNTRQTGLVIASVH
jgi:hypothetical protein